MFIGLEIRGVGLSENENSTDETSEGLNIVKRPLDIKIAITGKDPFIFDATFQVNTII